MPSTGRFAPSPLRTGGGDGGALARLTQGLSAARGSAYSKDSVSLVDAENEAIARMLFVAWEQTRRARNQFDPSRVTDFLARWEALFELPPAPGATLADRRAALAEHWSLFGLVASYETLKARLRARLGATFVDLLTTPLAGAAHYWPGGTTNENAPWYSTLAKLRVQLQWPSALSPGQFLAYVGRIPSALDPVVPAWVTWDWVVLGPGGAGFFFADPHNLGFEPFG